MSLSKFTSLIAVGTSALAHTSSHPELANFVVTNPAFRDIIGANPSITLLHNNSEPLFHEGGVYIEATDSLFVSSNRVALPAGSNNSTKDQAIKLSMVTNVSSNTTSLINPVHLKETAFAMPNGGALHPSGGGLLWCAQGSLTEPSGIYAIPDPANAPNVSVPVVTDFYQREFNGPNDVVANPEDNGTVWFTDVDYAHEQDFRNEPVLRNQVYRYDPASNTTRVVADGFDKPNGLAFNADFSVLYITDAGADAATNPQGSATIYAYDVEYDAPGTFLVNKRVFAFSPEGIPDGIKSDSKGNVWAGTGAGVVVWDEAGTELGRIAIKGGSANFGFGKDESTVFVLGEKMLWRAKLG